MEQDQGTKKTVTFADFLRTFRRGSKARTDIQNTTPRALTKHQRKRKKKNKMAKRSRRKNRGRR